MGPLVVRSLSSSVGSGRAGNKGGFACLTLLTMDDGQEGIRVQLRLLIEAPPEQRFDVHGTEVLQIRGHVVDGRQAHPEVIVRFSGQRRAELYRWCKPDAHLHVDGFLQVKHWLHQGRPRVALLVEAINLSPLDDVDVDRSRAGIYAVRGRAGAVAARAAPANAGPAAKEARARKVRDLLDLADA